MKDKSFHQLRTRLADPLLTTLTIMLAVIMFVVAPLQAADIVGAHNFGFGFRLMLVAAVFIVSGSWIAVATILSAIVLIAVATRSDCRRISAASIEPSPVNFDACKTARDPAQHT